MAIAREIERLGFTWFEEPIPQDDVGLKALLAREEAYDRAAAALVHKRAAE